ncbi:hypothetical protein B0H17DRAFT_1197224 [Mycena rosella]|uniref:Uncharacterized protein n=1 Tax=Mycena rosella TaxID=1033263 RepID=A0AAD7DRA4_MYCRO|nr:hypothetical protein B0H17DRAFT_1197224 [Mycena rosella]
MKTKGTPAFSQAYRIQTRFRPSSLRTVYTAHGAHALPACRASHNAGYTLPVDDLSTSPTSTIQYPTHAPANPHARPASAPSYNPLVELHGASNASSHSDLTRLPLRVRAPSPSRGVFLGSGRVLPGSRSSSACPIALARRLVLVGSARVDCAEQGWEADADDRRSGWGGRSVFDSTHVFIQYGRVLPDADTFDAFFNSRGFYNHTPFHMLTECALGATLAHLPAIWDPHLALERPAFQSPHFITTETFTDHLDDEAFYQAYLQFFSDVVLTKPVRAVLEEWIFSSKANYDTKRDGQRLE